MPRREPRPFWREQTGCHYVQTGKKQFRLSPDKDEAYRLYHELMSKPPEDRKPTPSIAPTLAVEVLDAFLGWVEANKAPRSFSWYRDHLQRFANSLSASLRVEELKPYHVTRVMDAQTDWSNNTKHHFARAVQRAFNWAEKEGLIDRTPLRFVNKPAPEARELAVSPTEYAEILAAVTEPNFRELIELAWETGARPQELVAIEARHVDLATVRVVFTPSEAKGKRAHRVIYLGSYRGREIVAALCIARPHGTLLRNSQGKPWNKDSINCAFCRLEARIGKKYHLGAFRKGWATEALKNGVDTVTVAHLMGHANAVMVSRVYAKVQQDPAFMAEAARRAKGFKTGADT